MSTSRASQWLGILISLLFVGLLLRSLRLDQVIGVISSANYDWLLPAVVISLVSFIFRGQRFRLFLHPIRSFSLVRSYLYIAINYMANNVLPARAGEVLLSYVVKQQEGIAISSSLAVTVLGRVLDGLLLLIGLAITLTLLPFPHWVDQVAMLGLLFFGGALAVLLWLVFGRRSHLLQMKRLAHQLTPSFVEGLVERILDWIGHFRRGLLPLKSASISSQALLLSVLIWVCEGSVYWCVGQMFGLHFSFIQTLFALSLANLAATIPSGPAGIGTFEGVVVIGLGLLGIDRSHAAAYALLLHATQVLPVTVVGMAAYFNLTVRQSPKHIANAG